MGFYCWWQREFPEHLNEGTTWRHIEPVEQKDRKILDPDGSCGMPDHINLLNTLLKT
jgi:hypothetical protein